MSIFTLNGQKISLDADLTIGEGDDAITYPAASLLNADLRAELGIVERPDQVRPDDRFYFVHDGADGAFTSAPKGLDVLRPWAIAEIKRQRQGALDGFSKSAGVSAIYAENVAAAFAVNSGAGDTTVIRTGDTARQYIDAMAAGMGVTPGQFIDYVLAENATAAKLAAEIEQEYVRLVYSFIPACTFDQVKTVVSDYQEYCKARRAE